MPQHNDRKRLSLRERMDLVRPTGIAIPLAPELEAAMQPVREAQADAAAGRVYTSAQFWSTEL